MVHFRTAWIGLALLTGACGGRASDHTLDADTRVSGGATGTTELGGAGGTTGTTGPGGAGGTTGTTGPGGAGGTTGTTELGGAGSVEVQPTEPIVPRTSFHAVAYGAGQYVAVGYLLEDAFTREGPGLVYRSADGRNWDEVTDIQPGGDVSDVAFGNGVFVAIAGRNYGSNPESASEIYVSNDARNWQSIVLERAPLAPRFAFGQGLFMAAHTSAAIVYTSTDGRTWQMLPASIGDAITSRKGVEFAAGVFAVYDGTDIVSVSGDGVTWQKVDATGPGTQGVARHWVGDLHTVNDHFVADSWFNCCFGELGGPWISLLESEDGYLWTQAPQLERVGYPLPWVETDTLCIAVEAGKLSSGTACEALGQVKHPSGFNYVASVFANGTTYLASGDGGILYSEDGYAWEQVVGPQP